MYLLDLGNLIVWTLELLIQCNGGISQLTQQIAQSTGKK